MNANYISANAEPNWWILLAIITFIAMVILGSKQYMIYRDENHDIRIKKVFGNGYYKLITIISSSIFGVLFSIESWRGVLQILDNHLGPNDSLAWSIILLPLAIITAIFIYAVIIYYIGIIAGMAKLGALIERKRYIEKISR